mmetsp:Transcript_14351/g.38458  ORF Transcript_14351/g.38458 Transcript_14351/m.38458 type:complete len:98 (-) Transcript_14351:1414-1707(-)
MVHRIAHAQDWRSFSVSHRNVLPRAKRSRLLDCINLKSTARSTNSCPVRSQDAQGSSIRLTRVQSIHWQAFVVHLAKHRFTSTITDDHDEVESRGED